MGGFSDTVPYIPQNSNETIIELSTEECPNSIKQGHKGRDQYQAAAEPPAPLRASHREMFSAPAPVCYIIDVVSTLQMPLSLILPSAPCSFSFPDTTPTP